MLASQCFSHFKDVKYYCSNVTQCNSMLAKLRKWCPLSPSLANFGQILSARTSSANGLTRLGLCHIFLKLPWSLPFALFCRIPPQFLLESSLAIRAVAARTSHWSNNDIGANGRNFNRRSLILALAIYLIREYKCRVDRSYSGYTADIIWWWRSASHKPL